MPDQILSWPVLVVPVALGLIVILVPAKHEDEKGHMRWRFVLGISLILYGGLSWWQQSRATKASVKDRESAIQETAQTVAAATSASVTKTVTQLYSGMISDQKTQIAQLQSQLAEQGKKVDVISNSNIVTGKSPIKVEVTNPSAPVEGDVQPPRVAHVVLNWEKQESVNSDTPYCEKIVLQSDIPINPVGFLVTFSAPVKSATPLGIKVIMQGRIAIEENDPTILQIVAKGIGDALLTPENPLVVLVCSDRDFKPIKLIRAIVQ